MTEPGRWAFPPLRVGPLEQEAELKPYTYVPDIPFAPAPDDAPAEVLAQAKAGDPQSYERIIMDKEFSNSAHNIRVRSGKLVNPWNLFVEDIVLDDIAFALSNECRYGGHVPFYSVGQHSLIVAEYFHNPWQRLAALLHDAEEAYLKDMCSPVKSQPDMKMYKDACYRARSVIFQAFDLDLEQHYPSIKVIDTLVYQRERIAFNNPSSGDITPWGPGRAYAMFKHEAEQLIAKIKETTNHVG